MTIWTFKVFVNSAGRDAFAKWISSQEPGAEEKIRALIRRLSSLNIEFWVRPFFDKIHGHKYLHEIRVKHNKIQYRPIGCFGPGPQTFTILIGASKKMNVWNPADALKIADKRRKLVFKDRRYLDEYQP